EESFTSTIMMVMIGLVSILPIAIVNKLFAQENRSLLSQVYATKVTRTQLFWTSIGLAIFASVVGILLAAGSLGGTAISAMGDSSTMNTLDFFAAGYNFLPSVLFFTGLAALVLGWAPKLGKVVYIYLTYSFLLNYFEGVLDLPEWFFKTAIQGWTPTLPIEDFDIVPFMTITVISLVLLLLGFLGYKNRDLIEGA